MIERFANAELAKCARREVRQRINVYPRLIESNRMREDVAKREIDMMTAIAEFYENRAERDAAMSDLFGGQR